MAKARSTAKKTKPKPKAKSPEKLRLNLALQGGGAHGAFTWGVLDRLLDEEDIEINGISGPRTERGAFPRTSARLRRRLRFATGGAARR